jgi:hypothetical protein
MTKREYPTIDNFLIWVMAVDYMIDELGIKKKDDLGKQLVQD